MDVVLWKRIIGERVFVKASTTTATTTTTTMAATTMTTTVQTQEGFSLYDNWEALIALQILPPNVWIVSTPTKPKFGN